MYEFSTNMWTLLKMTNLYEIYDILSLKPEKYLRL